MGDGLFFIVQSEEPNAVPEALYVGPILVDGAGCLRLRSGGNGPGPGATVVWRPGFSLVEVAGEPAVRGPDGRVLVTLGAGSFRMGGGYVPDVHEGIPLADEVRRAARERCPGSYWLVGQIP